MLTPDISIEAAEYVASLGAKQQAQIWKKIRQLCEHPTFGDNKKLEGYEFNRVRADDYRIIFDIEGDTLNVVLVGPRDGDEVNKALNRLYG